MFAEILAFMAGLSFWAKMIKYIVTVNHIGRFYDRMHKIYSYEDEQYKQSRDRESKLLLTNEMKEANAMKQRHSSAYPGEEISDKMSRQTFDTLGSRFDAKFSRDKRTRNSAGTSPLREM